MLKRRISLIIIFALMTTVLTVGLHSGASAAVDYSSIINAESSFITSCVLPSGAIIMGKDVIYTFQGANHYKINPYFSNFAALALLENPTDGNKTIVKNWMQWYFDHLNVGVAGAVDGSVFDYFADNLTGGTEHRSIDAFATEDIPNYDSTDSYASTFLILARKYIEVTGDNSFLLNNSYQIDLIGNSIEATMQSDGLTVCKPDYPIEYTMDNCEVNEGLKDMVWLKTNVYNDASATSYYQTLLDNNTKGIENNLWNASADCYDSALNTPSDWNVFYADATCQLYPVWTGVKLSTDQQSVNLYSKFNQKYPNWSTGTVYDEGGYPWAIVCYVAAVMGDTARVDQYLTFVKSKIDAGIHPDYWYNMEAAFTLLAAKKISSAPAVNLAVNRTATASYTGVSPALAVDGSNSTRWSSGVKDNEWWKVDLGSVKSVGRIVINWEAAYDTQYSVQVSADNKTYTTVYSTITGDGGTDTITFPAKNARYVKLLCTKRVNSSWGTSFWEFEVYNN